MNNVNIIVPAHNEADNIISCIKALHNLYTPDNNITISTDGNTDRTEQVIADYGLENKLYHLLVLDYPTRLGKGGAIKNALMQEAYNAIYDADMAVQPYAIHEMWVIAKLKGGIVITKRYAPERKKHRVLLSYLYNNIVRLLFQTGVSDHQCGCKVLSPEATRLAATVKTNDFFYDTELIVRCKRAGLAITEYPVFWAEHKKKSSVSLMRDSFKMLGQLVKLRLT